MVPSKDVAVRVLLVPLVFAVSGASSLAAQATSAEARMASWERHVQLERESPFGDLPWRAVGPKQAGARVEASARKAG